MSSQDLPTPVMDASDSAPAQSSKSNIPSILNTGSIPRNTAMKVQSDVLEPLTFSQSECVFRLQPRGVLHPGSSISIACDVNTNMTRQFPYPNVGVHAFIRRAVLRTTAGRVINDTDSWNKLEHIKSSFVQNSINKEREAILSGRQMDYEIIYDITGTADSTGSDVSSQGGFGLSNGYEYCQVAGGGREGLSVRPEILNVNEPEFRIKLSSLFKYCEAGNQLPLFLLPNEQVEVVLYWAFPDDQIHRQAYASGQVAGNNDSQITKSKCKLIADYVSYDNESMEALRQEFSKGLTFEYTEYRLSTQSLTGGAGGTAINNVRNVGGNGMAVESVLWSYQVDAGGGSMVGEFNSLSPDALGGAGNTDRHALTSNCFVNSEFLYPQDVVNPARQFHNLKETEMAIPYIPRALYSAEGLEGMVDDATTEFEGYGQRGEFAGQFFHQGFRLRGLSQRIDNRGIEVHSSAQLTAGAKNQNVWIEVKKYAVITDGHLETYFV